MVGAGAPARRGLPAAHAGPGPPRRAAASVSQELVSVPLILQEIKTRTAAAPAGGPAGQ